MVTMSVVEKTDDMNAFVDKMMTAMQEAGAPQVAIDMTDKVLRPYLLILDEHSMEQRSIEELMNGIDGLCATMITNLVGRLAAPDQLDTACDVAQECMDHIGQMVSETISGAYRMPGTLPN